MIPPRKRPAATLARPEPPNAGRADEHGGQAETAGSLMLTRLGCAAPTDRVAAVLASLREADIDFADSVFVVDDDRRLLGAVRMPRLLRAPGTAAVAQLMSPQPPTVTVDADQEHVASLAIRHGLAAVPVVDDAGRLLGVVAAEALIEVLRHEHVEDLHRLAGIRKENVRARHAIEAPPLRRARDRLPWLVLGLIGGTLATFVMSGFERRLGEKISIAFFVPGIVYLADAIGTQTEAIAVRGLSLSHAPIRSLLGGELRTGLLLGSTLALLTFPLVCLAYRDLRLAAAVSLSLLAAGTVATTMGILLPWSLQRLGFDPAFGSGPVATIVQDVLSLAIYFSFVVAIFG